jgi:hypothetical protein
MMEDTDEEFIRLDRDCYYDEKQRVRIKNPEHQKLHDQMAVGCNKIVRSRMVMCAQKLGIDVSETKGIIQYYKEKKTVTDKDVNDLYDILYGCFEFNWERGEEVILMAKHTCVYATSEEGCLKGDVAKLFSSRKKEQVKGLVNPVRKVHAKLNIQIKKGEGDIYDRGRRTSGKFYEKETVPVSAFDL